MEKKNFDLWLKHRQNMTNEGWFDWLFKPKAAPAPAQTGPTNPRDIYSNSDVQHYYQEILAHLGLNSGRLVYLDDKGAPAGDFDGTVPGPVQQALQRYIAGHVLGGGEEKTFMRISFHDAAAIIDFLDHLQVKGRSDSLADQLRLTSPRDLTLWFQTKLPTHSTAKFQQGYTSGYQTPSTRRAAAERSKTGPDATHPEMQELAKTIADLIPMFFKKDKTTPYNAPPIPAMRPVANNLIKQAKKIFHGMPEIDALQEIPAVAGGAAATQLMPGGPVPLGQPSGATTAKP